MFMPVRVMSNRWARSVIEASESPSCSSTPRRVTSDGARQFVEAGLIVNHMVHCMARRGDLQGVAPTGQRKGDGGNQAALNSLRPLPYVRAARTSLQTRSNQEQLAFRCPRRKARRAPQAEAAEEAPMFERSVAERVWAPCRSGRGAQGTAEGGARPA